MSNELKDIQRPKIIHLKKGELLFAKGDEGGTMMLIKTGELNIFTKVQGKEISLKKMGPGEVIGTASCLTGSPRAASAKALAACELIQYTAHQLQDRMAELPGWVGVVVKDITSIITEMNDKYSDAIKRIDDISRKGFTPLQKARLISNCIGTLTPMMGRDIDDKKAMFMSDLLPLVSQVVGITEEEMQPVVDVLMETGLIKVTIDPEKKKKYLSADYAKKNLLFAKFVQEAAYGTNRKLVQAQITPKQKRMSTALVRYAKSTGGSLGKPVTFNQTQLQDELKPKTTVTYHRETIMALGELSLFTIDKAAKPYTISFVPTKVSRMMAFIEAYHRIVALDGPKKADDGAPTKTATKPAAKPAIKKAS